MKNKKNGFTLLEVILTIAIIAIVTPVIYSLLFAGQKNFKMGTEEIYKQQETRLLRDYLTKDLRYASYLSNVEPKLKAGRELDLEYHSLKLEDGKLIKEKHENSESKSTNLSNFKGEEIDIKLENNILKVEYRYSEGNTGEIFTILLENGSIINGEFRINNEETLYFINHEDFQRISEDLDMSSSKTDKETGKYDPEVSYKKGDRIEYKSKTYISQKNKNKGNSPIIELIFIKLPNSDWWKEVN